MSTAIARRVGGSVRCRLTAPCLLAVRACQLGPRFPIADAKARAAQPTSLPDHPTPNLTIRHASTAVSAAAPPAELDDLATSLLAAAAHAGPSTMRHRAAALRARLAALDAGHFATPARLCRALGCEPTALSRLETHAVLHHLIRARRGLVAAGLVTDICAHAAAHRRRRVFAARTLGVLFTRDSCRLIGDRFEPAARAQRAGLHRAGAVRARRQGDDAAARAPPVPESSPTEQRAAPVLRPTAVLLDTLDALRRVRHRRPPALYELVIRQCCAERRPDEAAKVYVGLVEEWILEGRVAEGADPADFYEGGGPPRVAGAPADGADPDACDERRGTGDAAAPPPPPPRRRSSSLLSLWFGGVRTWRLPGEALSLHDRLDLWHPLHLSLGEKLRGFPLPSPTSPPTLVPLPATALLMPILDALQLDPRASSAADFASSMRALATLANPVLSRTLPIPAIPPLLRAFADAPVAPAVYPASFDAVPARNSWAYTANTQVHVALISLMWSPPNYARVAQLQQAHALVDSPATQLPPVHGSERYRLPPLGWKACMVLVEYGVARLRRPAAVVAVVAYMRATWASWASYAANLLVRGASLARQPAFADEMHDVLFGGTRLGQPGDAVAGVAAAAAGPAPRVHPDEESLVNLVTHLAQTGEHGRLKDVVLRLIPFLHFRRGMPQAVVDDLLQEHRLAPGRSGRPAPEPLTPRLWAALVPAIAKTGDAVLLHRVYGIATRAEDHWFRDHAGTRDAAAVRAIRLPIEFSTAMLEAVREQPRIALLGRGAGMHATQLPAGAPADLPELHSADAALGRSTRHRLLVRAEAYVQDIYRRARGRWIWALDANVAPGPVAPDARFFNALIAVRARKWRLAVDEVRASTAAQLELPRVMDDMAAFGYAPPPGLVSKLRTGRVDGDVYLPVEQRKRPAAPRPTDRRAVIPAVRDMQRRPRGSHVAPRETAVAADERAPQRQAAWAEPREEVWRGALEARDERAGVDQSRTPQTSPA